MMSDLSDLSDLSDICAAGISRAGKNARCQYPWVKYRGAPFTHYSHNSHNSHYSHFMRRPHIYIRHDRLYKTCAALPVRYDSFSAAPRRARRRYGAAGNRPPPPRVIRPDRLYKTCAALPVRYNCSQDTGLSNLTSVQPMLYTRCGMTAAWGRRFDVRPV